MKNITISIEDDLYRSARIRAAEQSTSVSAMVREFLKDVVYGAKKEDKFDRLLKEQNLMLDAILQKHPQFQSKENLSREELYDRHAIS